MTAQNETRVDRVLAQGEYDDLLQLANKNLEPVKIQFHVQDVGQVTAVLDKIANTMSILIEVPLSETQALPEPSAQLTIGAQSILNILLKQPT